jgi:hypothetical protein
MYTNAQSMLSVELLLQILYNMDAWSLCYYRTVSHTFNQLCIKALMFKISHERWAIELRTPSSAYAHYFNPDYISPQAGRLKCIGYDIEEGCLFFRPEAVGERGYFHKPTAHELQLHCKQWPSPVINLPRRALQIKMSPFTQNTSSAELNFTYSVGYQDREHCRGCQRPNCNEREIAIVQPQSLKVALSWIVHGFVTNKLYGQCSAMDFYTLSR